ncbi:MAG: hypothetical protein KDJ29_21115, partial [Hyphomicrobiales bacterium]|nr:hypothetical protein [Hyphomicrobiales bacterium]
RFSALPDAAGGKLGNFNFSNCVITSGNILATGEKAHDLLDRMRFAVQLGLAAELAGLGGALVARAGESLTGERDFANTALANTPLADVLMDVTLARAYANGAAGMAQPTRTHALEIIAGARSAASDAAMAASSLALAVAHGEKRSAIVEPLSRCALVASRIYRQPQAHRLRFVNWRWSTASGDDIFQTLFAAASAFAGGTGDIKMSGEVADLITANNRVRKIAEDYNLAGDPLFRDRHGGVELDLMGLVCADAQRLAGGDANAGFVMAAAKRTARKLAASTMYAAGTHAALADSGSDIASQFISASRC